MTLETIEGRTALPSEQSERPRGDALPEHIRYRDQGCDLFVSCLQCPLPRCRYEQPGGARTMLNRVRDREIRELRKHSELSVDQIAARFRVSRRTVFRALSQGRSRSSDEGSAELVRECREGVRRG